MSPYRNLLVGAQYEVHDNGAKVYGPGCGNPSAGSNVLGAKLQAGHVVSATQAIAALNMESVSAGVSVRALGRTPAPVLQNPLIEGQHTVRLYHLLPGASVEIDIDGHSILADYNSDGRFGVPQLAAGQTVKARQALCGRWSDWSTVTVQGAPGPVAPPTIEPKHYPCAGLVRLTEALPGEVEVYADQILIGTGEGRFIPVLLHLRAGQVLTATRTVGGVTSSPSRSVTVLQAPEEIPAPSLSAVLGDPLSFTRSIVLSDLLPGAQVGVFSGKLLIHTVEATDESIFEMLAFRPWPGTSIHARQSICGKSSPDSNTVEALGGLNISGPHDFNYWIDWPNYNVVNGPHTLTVSVRSYPKQVTAVGGVQYEKCPAFSDLPVTFISSDPNVVKVQGTGSSVIAAGAYSTDFQIELRKPGKATLTATANHYVDNSVEVSVLGGAWFEDGAGDTVYRQLNLQTGGSLNLKVFAKPVPTDRKIQLETRHGFLSVPHEVAVPQGQDFAPLTVTALSAGQDEIRNATDFYLYVDGGRESSVWVVVNAAAPPPPPPPKPKASVTLTYRMGPYPDPGTQKSFGTIKWTLTPQNIPAGQPGINKVLSYTQAWEAFPTPTGPGKYYIFVTEGGPYHPELGGLAIGTWQVRVDAPLWSASCQATFQSGADTVHFQEFKAGGVVNGGGYPGD